MGAVRIATICQKEVLWAKSLDHIVCCITLAHGTSLGAKLRAGIPGFLA